MLASCSIHSGQFWVLEIGITSNLTPARFEIFIFFPYMNPKCNKFNENNIFSTFGFRVEKKIRKILNFRCMKHLKMLKKCQISIAQLPFPNIFFKYWKQFISELTHIPNVLFILTVLDIRVHRFMFCAVSVATQAQQNFGKCVCSIVSCRIIKKKL